MKKRNLAVVVLGTAVFGMFANTMPASAAAAEAPAFVQYEGEWPAPGNEVANIIYDTDIADDVDDAGALAMLHSYAEEGRANILATLCNSTCIYGASCLEAINIYYGRPDIPVGTYKGDAVLTPDSYYYCKPVTMKYETTLRDGADARDAVEVYREVLSAQPDNSVTIVSVGFLSNLTALLNSEPDEYSDLDGVELMRQKVKLVCCMGGNFQDFDTAEFNFCVTRLPHSLLLTNVLLRSYIRAEKSAQSLAQVPAVTKWNWITRFVSATTFILLTRPVKEHVRVGI